MTYRSAYLRLAQTFQTLSVVLIGALALALLAYTLACAAGLAPWLQFQARFGDFTIPNAGVAAQVGLTAVMVLMCGLIPGQARVLALEHAHRDFQIKMHDVARAYHLCHTADRAGVFTLSSEFDEIRDRLTFLRDHPDMAELETDILTVAAQMSQQARKLADVYSDDKVKRAKEFLAQRQQEAEDQQGRIVEALHACREIRKWAQQVEVEESVVASQLAQLDEQLQAALPALGYEMEVPDDTPVRAPAANVVDLNRVPVAE